MEFYNKIKNNVFTFSSLPGKILFSETDKVKSFKIDLCNNNCAIYTKTLNEDIIDNQFISEIDEATMYENVIFDKNFDTVLHSMRKISGKNGNTIDINSPVICPSTGSKYIFFNRKSRNDIDTRKLEIDHSAYYLPIYKNHYGHLLFESLSRLWGLEKVTCKKIITNAAEKKWIKDMLLPFGYEKENIIFLDNKYATIKKIYCATPRSAVGRYLSPSLEKIYQRIFEFYYVKKNNFCKKIFLSRSNIKGRILLERTEIEKEFLNSGYHIVNPEEFSVSDQINMLYNASHIAGEMGSALHTLLLLPKDVAEKKIVTILTHDCFPIENQLLIHDMYKIKNNFIFGTCLNKKNPLSSSWSINKNDFRKTISQI